MIYLIRSRFTRTATIGSLAVDGVFLCYTLEPPKREDRPHCIPAGTYKVEMHPSKRFGSSKEITPDGLMPFLLDVPGFDGIMIHPGNFPRDTEGCILVGQKRDADEVLYSRVAFTELREKVSWPTAILIEEQIQGDNRP